MYRGNGRSSGSASLTPPQELSAAGTPTLLHALQQTNNSVLSLITDEHHIYSGSQSPEITVWDRTYFVPKTTLKGHTGSVLALEYASEKRWLFSASGDSTIRIWSTRTLAPLYVIHPVLETDSGDLFSLAWSPTLQTIYFGCQNTSIQWFNCRQLDAGSDIQTESSRHSDHSSSFGSEPLFPSSSPSSVPRKSKIHKFFDSYPQYERRPADIYARNGVRTSNLRVGIDESAEPLGTPPILGILDVPSENVVDSAHYGYVYCMALLPTIREGADLLPSSRFHHHLVTGSGDESIKLWSLDETNVAHVHTFESNRGAVLSLVSRGDTIFAGCQDGYVTVWDLETKTLVRSIIVQENVAVLSLSILGSDLYTCSEDGQLQRWSASFTRTASWPGHEGIALSSIVAHGTTPHQFELITGGNDDQIKVWDVPTSTPPAPDLVGLSGGEEVSASMDDTMLDVLSAFVSIPSVSSDSAHREDCRQGAIWLKKCLAQLGAEAALLPTGDSTSPLVVATFKGAYSEYTKPRVLFYGHYDVISAPSDGWESDPFKMAGRNGYLYGRGVADNKGPIIAIACAAAELLSRRALDVDLVFLIEGEEEMGSAGFEDAVRRHKDSIGHIDAILLSNSTWIAEDTPCITYGLRGVVHCNFEVASRFPSLHSGVDGGGIAEPMLDVIKLLSTLTDNERHVMVPGFYDHVRPETADEKQLYQLLSAVTQRPATELASRWREPSLSVHNISGFGPSGSTVIPGRVQGVISIRIVPDQDLDTIASSLRDHLQTAFAKLDSPNTLTISIDSKADWWLGDLEDCWFKALENAIQDEWGVQPLRIREGGSIPSIPFLEKEFKCHALHLPMGQSSDQAHLPDERISLANLRRGKSVIEKFLLSIAAMYRANVV